MKVVHIFWSLSYGGIETMLVNIANAQVSLYADVQIIILNDLYSDELLQKIDNRITVHLIKRRQGNKGFSFLIRLNRLLRKIAPDTIHLHLSKFYVLLWGRKLRRVTSVTLHALPRGSVRRADFLHRFFPILYLSDTGNVAYMDRIPKVFAISQVVKEQLWNKYRINSIVVNNGILTKNFKIRLKRTPSIPMSVVMVSRLEHKKKGQDLLIMAAATLKGKIHVTFIGQGNSYEYLKQLTMQLKIEPWIKFLGAQPQSFIEEHLCEYDLFVQPSRYEGFGLTVAEAMASQVPVLISDGQGPAEVTCGDTYGWVFENGNVCDLVKQIEYIISHYDEALFKAQKALQYVCDTYDVSVTARKYLDLYNA